jgi:oxygen-independent coproporphyrinogen-3 oxidase
VQNAADVRAWRAAVEAGQLATARGVARSADDRLRGAIIESLMCRNAADLEAICAAHGQDVAAVADALPSLQAFQADGLLRLDGPRLAVTEEGRPIVRAVCAAFDRYLRPAATAHSAAV